MAKNTGKKKRKKLRTMVFEVMTKIKTRAAKDAEWERANERANAIVEDMTPSACDAMIRAISDSNKVIVPNWFLPIHLAEMGVAENLLAEDWPRFAELVHISALDERISAVILELWNTFQLRIK